MASLNDFSRALASVPVSQPCTAAAVRALHFRVLAAAQQLFPELSPGLRLVAGAAEFGILREACAQQQLPGACLPVLAWLGDGLSSSSLAPAVSQQAVEVACMLLGAVSLAPGKLEVQLSSGSLPPHVVQETARLLQQLGAFEDVCKQLAKVASAVLAVFAPVRASDSSTASASSSSSSRAATAPTTKTRTAAATSSSRNAAPPPQQLATVMLAWQQTAQLASYAVRVQDEAEAVAALSGSGLYQVLLEGTLLLLSLDPQAYSQAPEGVRLQLAQCFKMAVRAANVLALQIGFRVSSVWLSHHNRKLAPGQMEMRTVWQQKYSSGSKALEPWMWPLFKLQVLVMAKKQWDVRQQPEQVAAAKETNPWPPAKLLTRAVRQLRSPCVAGDLLQQRAPGLVPHTIQVRGLSAGMDGLRWVVKQDRFPCIPAPVFGRTLYDTSLPVRACMLEKKTFDAIDSLDLALLLEVQELYCLVVPGSSGQVPPIRDVCMALQQAVSTATYEPLARFAATCGEALLGIAEYLVEDVLLVASAAEGATATADVPGSSAGSPASSSSRGTTEQVGASADRPARAGSSIAGEGAANTASPGSAAERDSSSTAAGSAGAAARSSSSSSSSSSRSNKLLPVAGGRDPGVTLEHRVWWAQDTVCTLGILMNFQEEAHEEYVTSEHQNQSKSYGMSVVNSLFTDSTAPGLLRLLEVALRTPELQGPRMQDAMFLLPWRLPLLHIVASSPGGSRALLSAVTSAVKREQVGIAVLSALVQSSGQLAPAAAAVAAAVPGRMGQVVAQQVLTHPETAVWQAVHQMVQLATAAKRFLARAAALLDPVLAPLAAYLAATRLPPGQDSKPWAVEAVLSGTAWLSGDKPCFVDYRRAIAAVPAYMSGIMAELTAALSLHQAAAARKQANKLAKAAGGGVAEAEQLRQQLQGVWLGRDGDEAQGLSDTERQALAHGQAFSVSTSDAIPGTSSGASGGTVLPIILQQVCEEGFLDYEEVLAAGDPSRWSSALGPTSEGDLRVASTALLAACKAAGAVAQLPGLLEQLQPILQEQPWGKAMVTGPTAMVQCDPKLAALHCGQLADWALLLAPLLAVLLPAQQAAELQEAAAGVKRDAEGVVELLTAATTVHVLGLLGHVVAPGAPGCSYPGCCNMEGRREVELPVQVCTRCRGAWYCCREHQVAHWKAGHKEVCQAAQAAAQQVKGNADV